MRKHVRVDRFGPLRESVHSLQLRAEQHFQLRREIDGTPLAILCCPGIQTKRPYLKIDLSPLQRKHLTLHPPAKGLSDRHRNLEIRSKSAPDSLKLVAFEEALPRRCLAELADHRHANQLAVLVGEAQHPSHDGELAVDRAVCGLVRSPLLHVSRDFRGPYRGHAPSTNEMPQVIEPRLHFPPISLPRRLVVALQIISNLLVANAVGARHQRLAERDSSLSSPEESLGLFLVLRARALAYRPSVRIVPHPEDRSIRAIPPSSSVDRAHLRSPFCTPSGGGKCAKGYPPFH